MKKFSSLLLGMTAIALTFCGCTAAEKTTIPGVKKNDLTISEEIMVELADPKYEGRLIGTKGNDAAAEYLEKKFKEMNMDPFSNNNYRVGFYTQVTADLTKQNPSVTFLFENGEERKLEYGKDYYVNAAARDLDVEMHLKEPERLGNEYVYTDEAAPGVMLYPMTD